MRLAIDEVIHHGDVIVGTVVRSEGSSAILDTHACHHGAVECHTEERKAGLEELAASLEGLPLDTLYGDLEQLEQRLTAIEEKMIATLRSDATDESLFEARRKLDSELKPYRSKMSADQLARLERQFLERKLLENKKLPRLSLFYLHS